MIDPVDRNAWHPVASSDALVRRHIFHGQLLNQEMAIWRADDGHVNAWENRCLHRGVRLTLGTSNGDELQCQYHGWRYASQSGMCTFIPAHPARTPPRKLCQRVYPAVERYGLVWSSLASSPDPSNIPDMKWLGKGALVLRPIPINAPPVRVLDQLNEYFSASTESHDLELIDRRQTWVAFRVTALSTRKTTRTAFFVQPVDNQHCIVRGLTQCCEEKTDELTLLRHHNNRLTTFRQQVELSEASVATVAPFATNNGIPA